MKIDDRIINYEISKQLPKSTPDITGKIGEGQFSDEHKAEGIGQSGQDAIVNISQASKEAKAINELISSEPDIREDKIAAIKEKIESGNYTIDYAGVADKLIDAFMDEIS